MSYNIEDRKKLINNHINKLKILRDELSFSTDIENQLSSLYMKLSKKNGNFIYGDIEILHVVDADGGSDDRRKKATKINLVNNDIIVNSDDNSYFYFGYLYSVPMTFPNSNYPFYVKKDGTAVYKIGNNTSLYDLYQNYIIDQNVIALNESKSNNIIIGLQILLEDMYYFTHEKNKNGEKMTVDNEVILSIRGILNYIDSYISNMNFELDKLNTPIVVSDNEQMIADIFNLKNAFDGQNVEYAGMIDKLFVGFGLYVENQELPSCAATNMQVANVERLNKIYVRWRDVVNIENLTCTIDYDENDDANNTYQVYRLDYEKVMKLPSRVLIPLVSSFITMSMHEVSHCEFDELIIFLVTIVTLIYTGQNVYAVLGGAWASAYVSLSIIAMSGQGSDDFKMAVGIALFAIGGYSSFTNMASVGYGTFELLGFSVKMSDGIFNLYSQYDLAKAQKEVDELAHDVDILEKELDLANTQDTITRYIYDEQYTEMYDTLYTEMYNIDSSAYMGSGFLS